MISYDVQNVRADGYATPQTTTYQLDVPTPPVLTTPPQTKEGIGFGSPAAMFGAALAMVLSYTTWHSILWAIVAGIFGWGYVLYFALMHP